MRTVLISGKQGSGKTSVQKKLCEKWNALPRHRAAEVNFADPLYEMHSHIWSVMAKYGIGLPTAKDGRLLQLLGTDWGRSHLGEDIWVRCFKERIYLENVKRGLFAYEHALIICGDCRFKNEFEAVEALRVRLNCARDIRKERCASWREDEHHQSETDLDEYDEMGKFDLYFDTAETSVDFIVDIILTALKK